MLLLNPGIVGCVYLEWWFDLLYMKILLYIGMHANPSKWSIPYVFDENYYGSGKFITEKGGLIDRQGTQCIHRLILGYYHTMEDLVYNENRLIKEFLDKCGYVDDGGCCVNRSVGLDRVSLTPGARARASAKTVETKKKNGTDKIGAVKMVETRRKNGIDKIVNRKCAFTKGNPIRIIINNVSINIASPRSAGKWLGVAANTVSAAAKNNIVKWGLKKLGVTDVYYLDKYTVTWEDMFDIDSMSFEELLTTIT